MDSPRGRLGPGTFVEAMIARGDCCRPLDPYLGEVGWSDRPPTQPRRLYDS